MRTTNHLFAPSTLMSLVNALTTEAGEAHNAGDKITSKDLLDLRDDAIAYIGLRNPVAGRLEALQARHASIIEMAAQV